MSTVRRLTTLQDVAARAGVSKTTAASILRNAPGFSASESTRRRVLEASAFLGYRRNALAASLSSGRTQTVGVLLPIQHVQNGNAMMSTYGQDIFMALFRAASRAGLRIAPIPPPSRSRPLTLADVADRRVDGLIFASLNNAAFVEEVQEAGIPCVEIGSGTGRYLVHPDNEGGLEQAVAHLVALGHKRIVHWNGGYGGFASNRRREGFLAAVARRELESAIVVEQPHADMERTLALPAGERPTAIITFSDYAALIVYDMARSAGLRVPDDLSVVGFDNKVLAEAARPGLTTIDNPLDEEADGAIEALQILWEGGEPTSRRAIPTQIVVRASTAPPPSGY